MVSDWYASFIQPANPLPADIAFVSSLVPESLEQLRARTECVRPAFAVEAPGVIPAALRRMMVSSPAFQMAVSYGRPPRKVFDDELSRRHLEILNAVFRTLERRGYCCHATVDRSGLRVGVQVCDYFVLIATAVKGHPLVGSNTFLSSYRLVRPDVDLVMTASDGQTWEDESIKVTLEDKISGIAAGLIVAGEILCRREVRDRAEAHLAGIARLDAERLAAAGAIEAERTAAAEALAVARLEREQAAKDARIAALRRSSEWLREADNIRALVARGREPAARGGIAIDPVDVGAWACGPSRVPMR